VISRNCSQLVDGGSAFFDKGKLYCNPRKLH
jgi:hypothetical protein